MIPMIKSLFLILAVALVYLNGFKGSAQEKTILAILAHPDDESAIAEVLIKYERLGHKVFLIIATDGKYGTRATSIPEGDSLGTIRKEESICACRIMGIEPPIFLGIDRLDTKTSVRSYFNSHNQLRDLLSEKISAINPDFIITFGPDGDTHHAEHIVVGGAVTEVILQNSWVEKYPLYYIAYEQTSSGIEGVGYMDPKYINVEISYSQEEELLGLEAYKCYATQYTLAELEDDRVSKIEDTSNKSFFRKFAVIEGRKMDFD